MARTGIAPLSTTIALAFPIGSSATSQRPTPKKITRASNRPLPPAAQRARLARERRGAIAAVVSEVAIGEPGHAIPPCRSGQIGGVQSPIEVQAVHDQRAGSKT